MLKSKQATFCRFIQKTALKRILMETCHSQVFRFSAHDPDEFGEQLAAGGVEGCSVSALAAHFHGEVVLGALPRLTFISSRIDNTRVLHRNFEEFKQVSINIPLAAPLQFRTGAKTRVYPTGTAFVRRPGEEFDLTTRDQSPFLGVVLSDQLLTWLTDKLGQPLMLGDSISLQTAEGESLYRYLSFVWGEIQRGGAFATSALATREIENSLAASLYAITLHEDQRTGTRGILSGPDYLKRAEEFIRANLTTPLSVLDVAAVAGVTPGSLSRAFRQYRGLTTKKFVRQCRLEAVQRHLLSASPAQATVTDVALRFGFHHLGRFSMHYRRAFGETPAETLRR